MMNYLGRFRPLRVSVALHCISVRDDIHPTEPRTDDSTGATARSLYNTPTTNWCSFTLEYVKKYIRFE